MNNTQAGIHTIQDLDRAARVRLGRLTQGLSPVSIVSAFSDWLVHLAISPGRQQELAERALRQWTRLGLEVFRCIAGRGEPCIEPLPQDHRFAAPEWKQWPYNLIYQAFLLNQQWWHYATTDVLGVTRHHEQQVTFAVRQMLDVFSPSNFLLTNPEALCVTVRSGGANLLQGALNRFDDAMRIATGQPLPGTEKFRPGHEVAVTPGKVVFRNHLIEVIQYLPQTERVFAEPVLLIPSWILKFYILDLSPGNSLVRYLVEMGHTVFMVSWKNPDSDDRDLGMDDYLQSGVMAAIEAVATIVPNRRIQAAGYCLGGTLLSMAAAYMARSQDDRLKSLTMLASELDFTEPGELGLFIDESQLAFIGAMMFKQGYLDGKQMAGAFALLNSRDLVWSRMEHDYQLGLRRPVTDVAAWNADATRMPYRQHREYLHSLYLRNDLAEGRYLVDGKPIALSDIRVPVFSLGTQRDTVSPWHSVYKVNRLIDAELTFCLTSGGHNMGVVNPPGAGAKRGYQLATRHDGDHYIDPAAWSATAPSYEGSWWPAWEGWLRQHAGTRIVPPQLGSKAHPVLDDAPGRYVLIP
ncbi:MAG TPA: alpha/beta fold hydrolase [Rhodocyclaceae bacterium]|nr:alpha/beta fold hydrolase [Rhodocyclaceae bacterium]